MEQLPARPRLTVPQAKGVTQHIHASTDNKVKISDTKGASCSSAVTMEQKLRKKSHLCPSGRALWQEVAQEGRSWPIDQAREAKCYLTYSGKRNKGLERLSNKTLPFLLCLRAACCPSAPLHLQVLLGDEIGSLSRLIDRMPDSTAVPFHPRRQRCSPASRKEERLQQHLL